MTQRRLLAMMLAAGGLGLINLVLVVVLAVRDAPPVILVPSQLSQRSEIGNTSTSDSYIADYAYEVALTFMNTTRSNLGYRRTAILKLTHPEAHGRLSADLDAEAARIERTKTSTSFWVSGIEVMNDPARPRAIVSGMLQVMLGKAMTYWRIYIDPDLRDRLAQLRDLEGRRLNDLLTDMLALYESRP